MPPRKFDKTPKKVQEKSTRSRVIKQKRVLNSPSILTLKIPKQTLARTVTEALSVNKVVKENEVVAHQELATKPVKLSDKVCQSEVVKEVKKTVSRKKPILKRKGVLKKSTKNVGNGTAVAPAKKKRTTEEDNNIYELSKYIKIMKANEVANLQLSKKPKHEEDVQHNEVTQVKKPIAKKKPTGNNKEKLKNNVPKKKSVTANGPVKKKRQCKLNPAKCTTDSSNVPEVKTSGATEETSKDNENIKSYVIAQSVRRNQRSLNRNKLKAGPILQNNQNSILKENISITICNNGAEKSNTMVDTNKDELVGDVKIANCLNNETKSVASSEKSWTKNISSSSATSLVTVRQEDFIIINNKLPILHLTNIDTELTNNKKHFSVVNNNHESMSIDDKVEYCARNKGNNVLKSDILKISLDPKSNLSDPNFCASKYKVYNNKIQTKKIDEGLRSNTIVKNNNMDVSYAVGTNDMSCPQTYCDTSSTSESESSSDSISTTWSSNNTNQNTSGNAVSKCRNMLQKNAIDTRKEDSIKDINIPGPSTITSTSTPNIQLQETGSSTFPNTMANSIIQKLALNIKKFSLEKIYMPQNTTEITNNATVVSKSSSLQDNIFRDEIWNYETNLIQICQHVTELTAKFKQSKIQEFENNLNQCQETSSNSTCVPPHTVNNENDISTNDVCLDKNDESNKSNNIQQTYGDQKIVMGSDISTNKLNNTVGNDSAVVDNDDDDALSLYAESFTGLDSYRRSSTINSAPEMPEREEYIPQSICKQRLQPIDYRPTKLTNENAVVSNHTQEKLSEENNFRKFVNNTGQVNNLFYGNNIGNYIPKLLPFDSSNATKELTLTPRLMDSVHKPRTGLKSFVFARYCFFHLRASCRRRICQFRHSFPRITEVQNNLSEISEELFIQEYMQLRTCAYLRNVYGLCFIRECIRRDLTRILIEMAIDFFKYNNIVEDDAAKVVVVDNILTHLNGVDFSGCADLLRYKIKPVDVELCDVFMRMIAMSVNFTRFRSTFIKLTQFMHQIGRKFSVEIAGSILEHICILPYDEMLVHAFLLIARNTDITKFSNSLIEYLERLLKVSNNDLYEQLKNLKDQVLRCQPNVASCHSQPLLNLDNVNPVQVDESTHCTDSTDLVEAHSPVARHVCMGGTNQNKTNFEITFSRKLRPDKLEPPNANNYTGVNSEYNDFHFNKWRHPGIFKNWPAPNRATGVSRQAFPRPPFKRRTDQSLLGSPNKFPRKSGPYKF